ncbi:hypothetical protein BOX15_Mlig029538g1, partial [Macrostomum lignano]
PLGYDGSPFIISMLQLPAQRQQLSAEAAAAAAVAAAAAAAAAPSPSTTTRQQQQQQQRGGTGSGTATGSRLVAGGAHQFAFTSRPTTNASTCVSLNNSERQQQQQSNANNDFSRGLESVQPIISSAGATAGDANKDEDLYTVLTVDAEELRNFYSDVYVVAECEGVQLKTKRTNKLEDIQTSFIFYRKHSTTKPIEFKMYASHQSLRRRVLIGKLSLTLQPGEPFDGMSVRRSIRERPELRRDGGSGLLFNFLSGMLHTQHLSGV